MILNQANDSYYGSVPVKQILCNQEIIWERPRMIGMYHVSDFDFVNKAWRSQAYPSVSVNEYQGNFPTIQGGTRYYEGNVSSDQGGVRLSPGAWFRLSAHLTHTFTLYLIAKCETVNDAFICSNYDGQNGLEIGIGIDRDWTFQGTSRLFSGISALNYHIIAMTGDHGSATIYIDSQKIAENFAFSDLPYAGFDFARRYNSFFSATAIMYQYIQFSTIHEDTAQMLATIQTLQQRYFP